MITMNTTNLSSMSITSKTTFLPSFSSFASPQLPCMIITNPSATIRSCTGSHNPKKQTISHDHYHDLLLPNAQAISYFKNDSQINHSKNISMARDMLFSKENNKMTPLESMVIVDTLQRMGIDHLFKDEIGSTLSSNFDNFNHQTHHIAHNLFESSLFFRLFREHGYSVSPKMLKKFIDKNGEFKLTSRKDIKGLMSLYEASHLNMGEDILRKGKAFSSKHLREYFIERLDNDKYANQVKETLEHPYHMSIQRYKARRYISTHQDEEHGCKHVVFELAKYEFNAVQLLHQRELNAILRVMIPRTQVGGIIYALRRGCTAATSFHLKNIKMWPLYSHVSSPWDHHYIVNWWKETGLAKLLSFVRDQPLKWYMWALTMAPYPHHSKCRIELTKAIAFIYIIDDIFDVYGTLDELSLFTQAINKWNISAINNLPNYMKICFNALHKVTNEIAEITLKDYGWNPINTLSKSWGKLCNAFLQEAKWFASKQAPNKEEYLRNAVTSSGVFIVIVHLFFLMGQGLTMENVQHIENDPSFVSQSGTILHLWDDLGSAKDENQKGFDGSYMELYMKEHQECSAKEAHDHVMLMISRTWEALNKECFTQQSSFPKPLVNATLNLARMVRVMYSYNDDNHHLPMLDDYIFSLLHHPL